MKNDRDYMGITFGSPFLRNMIQKIDDHLCEQEEYIDKLEAEKKELLDEQGKRLNADIKAQQDVMANTLKACLGTPSLSSLGPVGATVIARIRDMKTIEQVQEYIEELAKDNEEELERMKNEQCQD